MKVLDKEEKDIYNWFMQWGCMIKKLNCWNLKAPDDFENHVPKKDK